MKIELIEILLKLSIETLMKILVPIIGGGLIMGISVALLQATIQLNEQAIAFSVKLVTVLTLITFLGVWIVETLVNFIDIVWSYIPKVVG